MPQLENSHLGHPSNGRVKGPGKIRISGSYNRNLLI